MQEFEEGNLVLASEWADGHIKDGWAMGYFAGYDEQGRIKVKNSSGRELKGSTFRAAVKIEEWQAKAFKEKFESSGTTEQTVWGILYDIQNDRTLGHKELLGQAGLSLVHLVSMDVGNCIGKDNLMQWDIPAESQRFLELTEGNIVLMGRKTYESFLEPIEGRTAIVLTKDENFKVHEGTHLAHSLEDALHKCVALSSGNTAYTRKVYVIGGESLYKQTQALVAKIAVIHVTQYVKDGDAHYPHIPSEMKATYWKDYKAEGETPAYSVAVYTEPSN